MVPSSRADNSPVISESAAGRTIRVEEENIETAIANVWTFQVGANKT